MTQTPAGWYPDPAPPTAGRSTLRYWDGQRWTEHVAPTGPAQQPVAPAVPRTPDGEPLSGWWWRVLAYLLDGLVLGIVGGLFSLPAQIGLFSDFAKLDADFQRQIEAHPTAIPPLGGFYSDMLGLYQGRLVWLVVPSLLVSLVYVAGMLRWKGATLGKLAVGLRVRLREAPGQLPWPCVAIRWAMPYGSMSVLTWVGVASGSWILAGALLTVWSLFFYLDALWATWDPKKQTLHDKVAKTNVVKTR